jgi:hypothetical protein
MLLLLEDPFGPRNSKGIVHVSTRPVRPLDHSTTSPPSGPLSLISHPKNLPRKTEKHRETKTKNKWRGDDDDRPDHPDRPVDWWMIDDDDRRRCDASFFASFLLELL